LPDLSNVIRKNWEKFSAALGKKNRFEVYMDRIEAFRVAVMHSRELLPFEKRLLQGMSGEIRNRVTIAVSGSDPDLKYFPRIERVHDSFGNEAREDHENVDTGLTLRVGDIVRFSAVAWDPEDADLTWEFQAGGPGVSVGPGSEVHWNWEIGHQHVGVGVLVWVFLKANRPYHKYQQHDGFVTFEYRVLPR
jgi:hypothetical protein